MDYLPPQVLALRQIPMPQGTAPYTAIPQQNLQYTTQPVYGAPQVTDARAGRVGRPGTSGAPLARAGAPTGGAVKPGSVARDVAMAPQAVAPQTSTPQPISNEDFPYQQPSQYQQAFAQALQDYRRQQQGIPQAGGPLVDRNGVPIQQPVAPRQPRMPGDAPISQLPNFGSLFTRRVAAE